MGFPVACGAVLPKLVLVTAMSVAAIRDFCRALFEISGLFQELEIADGRWHMDEELESRMNPWWNSADDIRESLPAVLFLTIMEQYRYSEDTQCAVCLNNIGERQEVRQLPNCCHIFHKDCIDKWLDHDQTTCPLCRSSVISETLARKENQIEQELHEELGIWTSSHEEGENEFVFRESRNY